MNEKLEAWNVETVDLAARVAAAIGSPSNAERELRDLQEEVAELRAAVALLGDEVARLRAASSLRRIVPFGPAEGLFRLS